jgi:uncharacterized protein
MDVVKVGDVHEFTIIELDRDRRRIALSLKSDAASRAGTGQKSTVRRDTPRDNAGSGSGTGRRVVVVKKAGTGNTGSQSRDRRDDNRRSSYNSGSDDGMSYNPFAAFFNGKK